MAGVEWNDKTIASRVRNTIGEMSGYDPDELTDNQTFGELAIDSLDIVEILMGLEDDFDIDMADDTLQDTDTVLTTVQKIKEHLDARGY